MINMNMKKAKCIYPNLEKWVNENMNGSFRKLFDAAGICSNSYPWLSGQVDPSKYSIDSILDVTGMTYEEAFATDVFHQEGKKIGEYVWE